MADLSFGDDLLEREFRSDRGELDKKVVVAAVLEVLLHVLEVVWLAGVLYQPIYLSNIWSCYHRSLGGRHGLGGRFQTLQAGCTGGCHQRHRVCPTLRVTKAPAGP